VGNLLELPFPDRAFEVVLSYRLLPHVSRWKAFIAELTRVAGKMVIVDYPEKHSLNALAPQLFQFKQRLEGNTRPYTCYRESEVLEAFQARGFFRTERFAQFFLPMVLHRNLKHAGISRLVEDLFRRLRITGWLGSPVILKLERAHGTRPNNHHVFKRAKK
jgi:ubiquinone/menaquinone biosynthesis C-methylase UbiE